MDPLAALFRIGHAFFARDGVRLAFGKRWDGEIIHISQASRGSACGCQCPAKNCGPKLVARKPDGDIAHHFAHAPLTAAERAAGIAPSCKHGNMTALHHYAEQLLNSRKSLVLPPVQATYGARTRTMRQAKPFVFDSAMLETMDGETIPDVILRKGDDRMQVEVYVTHRCGPEKRAKIAGAGISAVEIDLSALSRDTTIAGLDEAILTSAPREWIYNRRAAHVRNELERIAGQEAAAAEERRRNQIEKVKAAYASARRKALGLTGRTRPKYKLLLRREMPSSSTDRPWETDISRFTPRYGRLASFVTWCRVSVASPRSPAARANPCKSGPSTYEPSRVASRPCDPSRQRFGLLAGGTRERGSPVAIAITAPFPGALLTGLVAALGPAWRLRRRYAHAPAGCHFSEAMRPWRTPDRACGPKSDCAKG